jgi:hypothetical protein
MEPSALHAGGFNPKALPSPLAEDPLKIKLKNLAQSLTSKK